MALNANTIVQFVLKGGSGGIQSLPDSLGVTYTLSEDLYYHFSTTYSNLYANVTSIRLFGGSFLNDVPDDTIAQMIYIMSREAEALANCTNFNIKLNTDTLFCHGVTQYVKGKAVFALLGANASNIMSSSISAAQGYSKRLGDLEIAVTGTQPNRQTTGLDDVMDKAIRLIMDWESTVRSCGALGPGDDYTPGCAVRGSTSGVLPPIGRGWTAGKTPAINSRVYTPRYKIKNGY